MKSILIVCILMLPLLLFGQAVALYIPTDGLVAYYSFDDGTATDNSGNGYNGTISVGSAVPVEGFYGMGLQFDGYDDGVRLPQLFTSDPRTITVIAFIKPDASGTNAKTVFQNAHYNFALTIVPLDPDDANIRMGAALGSYSNWYRANTSIPMGKDTWYAVAGTVDTNYNNATIYVNGTLKDKIPLPGISLFYWNEGYESIGASDWAGGRVDKYRGIIDEVMIYNRTLSANEIAAICEDFINRPPLAQDDIYTMNQDTVLNVPSLGVLENDNDPEGEPLTASVMSLPINGVLSINSDGSFTYTPLPGWYGNVTFTYKANDSLRDSNISEVLINVTKTPEPIEYIINATSREGGNISPSGDTIVTSGGTQVFNLLTDKKYIPASITIDNITIDLQDLAVTFNNVLSNHTIHADFVIVPDNNSSITLVSPNGGENWTQGSTHTICWNYTGNPGSMVRIEALRSGSVLATVTSSYPLGSGGVGNYPLTFPYNTPVGSDYRFRVISTSNPDYNDTSDNPFTIIPAINVTSPNGGEIWQQGSSHLLTWNYTGNPGPTVKIEALRSGVVLATIASGYSIGTGGSGSFNLTLPAYTPIGDDYQIRVTSTSFTACTDTSDAAFTIILA